MKKILNTGKLILGFLMYVLLLNRKKVSSEIEEKKVLPIKEPTLLFKGKEMPSDGIEIVA